MPLPSRKYLAAIGKRGGTRSRRTLSAEQAREMVAVREARRTAKAFALSAFAMAAPALPGIEIVGAGLAHLAAGQETEEALLVSMAAPRLRLLGIRVPRTIEHPEERLYDRLYMLHGDGAHSRYNALVRRMVSFARAARSCVTSSTSSCVK
ncbi:hypothetical protein [Gemmatimonas sp.]|uniref:hypothetical protein n=1 Tax=Gemmatimonas sp. TaxID=1962908 RepID=UPI00356A81D6